MADTFIKIASVTVGAGGASSIDFTSIPSTYTDLCVKFSVRTSNSNVGQSLNVTYNGSSSYANRYIEGAGSGTPLSGSGTDKYIADIPGNTATANIFGNGELYIANYTSSVTKATSTDAVSENNGTTSYASLTAQTYANTSAITSISLASGGAGSPTLMQYSTATLYGIKNS